MNKFIEKALVIGDILEDESIPDDLYQDLFLIAMKLYKMGLEDE